MRRESLSVGVCALLVLVAPACHLVLSYDNAGPDDSADSGAAADAATMDGARLDGGPPAPDAAPTDAPADTLAPDLPLPDVYPHFDLGGTSCKTLWLEPTPRQVSKSDKTPAGRPHMVAVGDTFYVVYEEGGGIDLVRLDGPTPGTLTRTTLSKMTLSKPDHAPWIVHNAKDKRLAVLWHRDVNVSDTAPYRCDRDLMFGQISLSGATLTPAALCSLTSTGKHGFGPATMAYHNGDYIIVSPLHYNGKTTGLRCFGHVKGWTRRMPASTYNTSCSAVSSGSLNPITPFDPELYNPVVATVGSGPPYRVLWGRGQKVAVPPPQTVQQQLTSGAPSGTSLVGWTTINNFFPLGDVAGPPVRPAIVGHGGALWTAHVQTGGKVYLKYTGAGSAGGPLQGSGAKALTATGPFLAAGTHGVALTVSTTPTAGGPIADLELFRLARASGGIKQTHQLTVRSGSGGGAPRHPRASVVAAGDNGFGVVWVEDPGKNSSEVFFRWVGCQ